VDTAELRAALCGPALLLAQTLAPPFTSKRQWRRPFGDPDATPQRIEGPCRRAAAHGVGTIARNGKNYDNERRDPACCGEPTRACALSGMQITLDHTLPIPIPYPTDLSAQANYFGNQCRMSHGTLLHNHPSGDPKPARDDIQMTREIKAAAEAKRGLGRSIERPRPSGVYEPRLTKRGRSWAVTAGAGPSWRSISHAAFTACAARSSHVRRPSDSAQLPLIGSMIVLTRETRVAGIPAALA
jgi:hypothetical protein